MSSHDCPAVRLELENEWAWCGARRLALTPRAFAVLRYLVEHRARLITKAELLTTVWRDTIVSDAALSSCIRDLRKALGDPSSAPRYIQTAHRRGFRFIGPVAAPTASSATCPSVPSSPSSTLVGREAELARLHALLGCAMQGQRQLVFVTGELGIGKTALVELFLAQVGDANGRPVGRGQCVDQYGAGEAYLPVLEALGRLGRTTGGERLVEVLTQHAPTWLEQLPGLLKDREIEAVRRRAQGATRERMLRELVEALDALTVEAPLVIVMEDLHWSDTPTIELLGMLARRREPSRVLILGTYRPADVAAAAHPLERMKYELRLHGHCEEISLGFLSAPAVGEYLARRFPGHALPSELALVLHRNTEGNPLFLVNTIDDLVAQGQLRDDVDGRWRLSGRPEDVAWWAPKTLWQLAEKQIELLKSDEQAILEAASVAGAEFSAAAVAAAGLDPQQADQRCEALARRSQLLRAVGVAEWPDGTIAGRYAFIHALYHQVLYARVAIAARVALHLKTAERLERGWGERAGEIAGELAMHFELGRDFERAARYRRRAGEHALHQHAYREAAAHATRGLEALRALPDSPHRAGRELGLQVTLGAALAATEGYGAPDVARTYARAWELCSQVGETPELVPVLRGLGRFYVVRGEFQTARNVGAHLLAVAEPRRDPTLLAMAHNALGVATLYAGDFQAALVHLEQGLEWSDSETRGAARSLVSRLVPPAVTCAIHAAWALWMLGYPERAGIRARDALAVARSLDDPFSLSYACHLAAALHHWRREHDVVQALEDEALAPDREHGFALLLTSGVMHRGWLLAERGQSEDGLAQMQQGLATYREIGAAAMCPAFLGLVAEVQHTLGRPTEARSTMAEAMSVARQSGRHYWEAELHRLTGVLSLQTGAPTSDDARAAAESSFRRAIDIARRQHARWLELRAAKSLSRLWADHGHAARAHALLSGVYGWFTEGFDTADLREAKSLLDSLAGAS